MKKLMCSALVLGCLSGGVLAAESQRSQPMQHLDQAFKAITQGDNKVALNHLTWCYDKGVEVDSSFIGIRNTYVIDTLGVLGKSYPPARDMLVDRRTAAMARIGSRPNISLDVFEVLALNRALGEVEKNKELLARCSGDAGIKQFATQLGGRSVGTLTDLGSSETIVEADVAALQLRVDSIRNNLGTVDEQIEVAKRELQRLKRDFYALADARQRLLGTRGGPDRPRIRLVDSQMNQILFEIARVERELQGLNASRARLATDLAAAEAELDAARTAVSTPLQQQP